MQGATLAYLLIGIFAGLLSTVMFVVAIIGSFVLLLFVFVIPMPLYVAGLGWGALTALVGSLSGTLAIGVMTNLNVALFFLLSIGTAPVLISHYALKSRPVENEDGTEGPDREWYPEGRLVLISAAFIIGSIATAVIVTGVTPTKLAALGTVLSEDLDRLGAGVGAEAIPGLEQFKESMKRLTSHILTISAVGWTIFVVLGWALSAKLLSVSGRSIRDWAPFHRLDLPRGALIVLAVAALASFMGGQLGVIGSVALAAVLTAFFILGIACAHGLVAKSPVRTPLLFGFYTVLFIFPLALPAVLVLGLVEHLAGLRARIAGITPTPS